MEIISLFNIDEYTLVHGILYMFLAIYFMCSNKYSPDMIRKVSPKGYDMVLQSANSGGPVVLYACKIIMALYIVATCIFSMILAGMSVIAKDAWIDIIASKTEFARYVAWLSAPAIAIAGENVYDWWTKLDARNIRNNKDNDV